MTSSTPSDRNDIGEEEATDSIDQADADEGAPETTRQAEKIRVLGFFAADHAVEESGKVYVHGGYWTILRFPTFPAVLPTCAVVAVLQIPFQQTQADHTIVIRIEGGHEENEPLRVEGQFRTAPAIEAEFGEPGVVPFAMGIHGLTFERPGAFRFVLEVDGEAIDSYSFRVIQVAVRGQASPSTSPRR